MLHSAFWVFLGGGIGSVGRYALTTLVTAWLGPAFPWGTVLINISGSFVIGLYAGLSASGDRLLTSPTARDFVMAGLCGGYTTFSAFSLQTLNLVQRGNLAGAAWNVGLSVALCLLAVWLGHVVSQAFR